MDNVKQNIHTVAGGVPLAPRTSQKMNETGKIQETRNRQNEVTIRMKGKKRATIFRQPR